MILGKNLQLKAQFATHRELKQGGANPGRARAATHHSSGRPRYANRDEPGARGSCSQSRKRHCLDQKPQSPRQLHSVGVKTPGQLGGQSQISQMEQLEKELLTGLTPRQTKAAAFLNENENTDADGSQSRTILRLKKSGVNNVFQPGQFAYSLPQPISFTPKSSSFLSKLQNQDKSANQSITGNFKLKISKAEGMRSPGAFRFDANQPKALSAISSRQTDVKSLQYGSKTPQRAFMATTGVNMQQEFRAWPNEFEPKEGHKERFRTHSYMLRDKATNMPMTHSVPHGRCPAGQSSRVHERQFVIDGSPTPRSTNTMRNEGTGPKDYSSNEEGDQRDQSEYQPKSILQQNRRLLVHPGDSRAYGKNPQKFQPVNAYGSSDNNQNTNYSIGPSEDMPRARENASEATAKHHPSYDPRSTEVSVLNLNPIGGHRRNQDYVALVDHATGQQSNEPDATGESGYNIQMDCFSKASTLSNMKSQGANQRGKSQNIAHRVNRNERQTTERLAFQEQHSTRAAKAANQTISRPNTVAMQDTMLAQNRYTEKGELYDHINSMQPSAASRDGEGASPPLRKKRATFSSSIVDIAGHPTQDARSRNSSLPQTSRGASRGAGHGVIQRHGVHEHLQQMISVTAGGAGLVNSGRQRLLGGLQEQLRNDIDERIRMFGGLLAASDQAGAHNGNFMTIRKKRRDVFDKKDSLCAGAANYREFKQKLFIGDLHSTQFRQKSQMRHRDDLAQAGDPAKPDQFQKILPKHARQQHLNKADPNAKQLSLSSLDHAQARYAKTPANGRRVLNNESSIFSGARKSKDLKQTTSSMSLDDEAAQYDVPQEGYEELGPIQIALKTSTMQQLRYQNIKDQFNDLIGNNAQQNQNGSQNDKKSSVVSVVEDALKQDRKNIMNQNNCQNNLIETGQHQIFQDDELSKESAMEHRLARPSAAVADLNLEMVIQELNNQGLAPPNLLGKSGQAKFKNLRIKKRSQPSSFSSLSGNEIMRIAKQKNQDIYDTICTRISQLMWLGQTTSRLDSLTPLRIRLEKISAVFIKCPVEKKPAPMKIMFREFNKASSTADVQVFWSFTNPYPCDGNAGEVRECDGFFEQQKIMTIQPYNEATFGAKFIHLGIYTQKGFKDEMAYSFGNRCEKFLAQAFGNQTQKRDRSRERLVLFDCKKAATYDKLAQFREQTQEKVQRLLGSQGERELFFIQVKAIKEDHMIHKKNEKDILKKQSAIETKKDQERSQSPASLQQSPYTQRSSPAAQSPREEPATSRRSSESQKSPEASKHTSRSSLEKVTEHTHENQDLSIVDILTFKGEEQEQEYEKDENPEDLGELEKELQTIREQRFQLSEFRHQHLVVKERRDLFNKDLNLRREIHAHQIKKLELNNLKYNMFYTIKHDILKLVKDQKLDELIAVLRKRKFGRVYVYSQAIHKIISVLFTNIGIERERRIKRMHTHLKRMRIISEIKKVIRRKFGANSTLEQRLELGYIRPYFTLFANTTHSLEYIKSKRLLQQFLRDYSKMMQPIIKVVQTSYKVLGFKKKLLEFVLLRRSWFKEIQKEVEKNHRTLKNLIMISPILRKTYDWLVEEFSDLQEVKESTIRQTIQEFFNYIRSIHILDHHRWLLSNSAKQFNVGRVSKLAKECRECKLAFVDQYQDDLGKYPIKFDLQKNSQGSIAGKKGKKAKNGGKLELSGATDTPPQNSATGLLVKQEEASGDIKSSSRALIIQKEEAKSPKGAKKAKKKKKARNQNENEMEYQDDLEFLDPKMDCTIDLIDRFYQEYEIPKCELQGLCLPQFDIRAILESALTVEKLQSEDDGGALSSDLGPIMTQDEIQENHQSPHRECGKAWGINLQELVYKCLIKAQNAKSQK